MTMEHGGQQAAEQPDGRIVALSMTPDEARTLAALLSQVRHEAADWVEDIAEMLAAAAVPSDPHGQPADHPTRLTFATAAASVVMAEAAALLSAARDEVGAVIDFEEVNRTARGAQKRAAHANRKASEAADLARITSALATARTAEAVEAQAFRAALCGGYGAEEQADVGAGETAESAAVEAAAAARAAAATAIQKALEASSAAALGSRVADQAASDARDVVFDATAWQLGRLER